MTPATAPGVAPKSLSSQDADEHLRITHAGALSGLESATKQGRANSPVQAEQEATTMEGSVSPINPAPPGVTSETIHDENQVAEALDESQRAYTRTAPHPATPEMTQRQPAYSPATRPPPPTEGGRLSWLPGVALAALIVGIAAWTASRSVRRGRKRAAKAAKAARKSAATLAQTMRANAKEVAARQRDTASDTLSNLSADVQARYRWFRRGMRVGAQTARFQ
jgi:hypothetical protein